MTLYEVSEDGIIWGIFSTYEMAQLYKEFLVYNGNVLDYDVTIGTWTLDEVAFDVYSEFLEWTNNKMKNMQLMINQLQQFQNKPND